MASRMAGPIFRFHLLLQHVQRRPPRARWWSRCLAARPPSALLFTYLCSSRTNSRCARRCTIVNMANSSDKSEKNKKYMQKYKDEYGEW